MAVIVTDMEMPVSCNCCDFGQRLNNMSTFCVRKPFEVPIDDTYGKRPDWCPLKEQKAVKPRVSSVEQRCGNCNKVIEMDGWKACPWCGKPILWEAVGRSVKLN